MTEWLRVMLDEISRKRAESEQARGEERRRRDESAAGAKGQPGTKRDERRE
jgi:hypothetical protein